LPLTTTLKLIGVDLLLVTTLDKFGIIGLNELTKLFINGTKYIIAKGGLHSKDDPKIYDIQDKPNTIMRDADVVSYYPNIILNLRVHPKHLVAHAFLGIVKFIMDSRIRAKHEYSKVEDPTLSAQLKKKAEIYKIAINRIYGAFKDSFDFEYDPECTYKTTINGQLYLLMLIEELELNGIHVISAILMVLFLILTNLLNLSIMRYVLSGRRILITNLSLLIMRDMFVLMLMNILLSRKVSMMLFTLSLLLVMM
jgi:hypothetical protein